MSSINSFKETKASPEQSKVQPSQSVIDNLWKQYLEENKDYSDSFYMGYAINFQPQWKPPGILFFHLKSNIILGSLNNNKSHIGKFFSDRIDVENLKIESEVEEVEVNKDNDKRIMMRTPEERLNDLKEKNPSVNLLIEKLGLGFGNNE